MLRTGCRAFVAFAGGLDIPVVMGSRSTNMKAKIGGYQGRKLQKDDVIGFRAPKTDLKNLGLRHTSPEFMPRAEYKLRIVLGPQDDAFTERGITTFLSSVYTLTKIAEIKIPRGTINLRIDKIRSLTAWAAVLMAS